MNLVALHTGGEFIEIHLADVVEGIAEVVGQGGGIPHDIAQLEGNLMAPFVVRKNMGFLGNWTLRELRMARHRFLALRERVVSGSSSGGELVAVEMARACWRGR